MSAWADILQIFERGVSRNILWYGSTYAHQISPQHALNTHFMDLLLPPRSFFIRLTLLRQRCWNNELCLWLGTSWSVPETTGSSVFNQVYGRWLQPPSPSHVPVYMGEWWWGCLPSTWYQKVLRTSPSSSGQGPVSCRDWCSFQSSPGIQPINNRDNVHNDYCHISSPHGQY